MLNLRDYLVDPAELGGVLEVLNAAVLGGVAEGAGIRGIAVGREHGGSGHVGLRGLGSRLEDKIRGPMKKYLINHSALQQ